MRVSSVKKQLSKNETNHDKSCMQEIGVLKIENMILKSSLGDSKETVVKFVEEEKNLEMIIGQQNLR